MPPRRSAMDYESMATTMDSDPLEQSQMEKARRTVAANAIDAADATELMMMLGIHPSQPQDTLDTLPVNNLPNPNNK